ncbi:orotidine-5'-phosphate decarboxylase [Alteribacillus sp. HJP-4]|uniref:orotidine-5'-phosphate decarboxylase n=1 Tax=Alteribacillus sp. HJP-4 TaxID=2775394 RepID=UPI0035CD0ECB
MKQPLIIALDFSTREKASDFLKHFQDSPLFIKVGMELFYKEGPSFVKEMKLAGMKIFLDLKLHDIPHTVYRAARQLAELEIDLLTVHAAGGREMMEQACRGAEEGTPEGRKRPLIAAVTQLTSTDDAMLRDELLLYSSMEETVLHYAKNAKQAGLDGVICSAFEVPRLKEECGESFLAVTPGIRAKGDAAGDQKRVATPSLARQLGSDAIVVGRSITAAADPAQAYQSMNGEWKK